MSSALIAGGSARERQCTIRWRMWEAMCALPVASSTLSSVDRSSAHGGTGAGAGRPMSAGARGARRSQQVDACSPESMAWAPTLRTRLKVALLRVPRLQVPQQLHDRLANLEVARRPHRLAQHRLALQGGKAEGGPGAAAAVNRGSGPGPAGALLRRPSSRPEAMQNSMPPRPGQASPAPTWKETMMLRLGELETSIDSVCRPLRSAASECLWSRR